MARSDIEAGRAFVRLYMKSGEFEKGMRNAKKLLGDFADALKNMGRSMIAIGVAGIVPIGISARKFMEFDDALRAARAAAEFTAEEMKALGKIALDMSVKLGYTGTEVANMMAILARADFKITDLEAVTQAVLQMSRATGTDATNAAQMFAVIFKTFGKTTEQAVQVVDAMTLAANRSIIEVENLGDSMKYAGPQAADLGYSMEDTVAIIAQLGRFGLIGETAGTAMRRLTTITAAEAAKLKTLLGVNFHDAAGNVRPLIDSFQDLHERIKNLPTGIRAARLNEAFGILGITGASLLSNTTVAVKELSKDMKEMTGVSAAAAAIMNNGLGGAFRILNSLIHRASIELGQVFSEDLINAGEILGRVIVNVMDFVRENKGLIVLLVKGALAVGLIGGGLLALGTAIRWSQYAVSGLLSVFGLFSGAYALFNTPAKNIMTSARLMSATFGRAFGSMNRSVGNFITSGLNVLKIPLSSVGVMLRTALGGAVSLFARLPSIASSAASGMRTALLGTAAAAKQFWMGLTGTSKGFVSGLPLLFRGLGGEVRALGAVIRANQVHLIKFWQMFLPIQYGSIGHAITTLVNFKYVLYGLFNKKVNFPALDAFQKQLYTTGSYIRYNLVLLQQLASLGLKKVTAGFNSTVLAVRLFVTALRGASITSLFSGMLGPQIFAKLTAFQRAFWFAGARINYAIRTYIIAPISRIGAYIASTRAFQVLSAAATSSFNVVRQVTTRMYTALASAANKGLAAGRVFWAGLSGSTIFPSIQAKFNWLQKQAYFLGGFLRSKYIIPFRNGTKAMRDISVQAFRVITQAGRIAALLTSLGWKAIGGPISTGLKLAIGGAFRAIRFIGTTTALTIRSAFRSAMGGIGALSSLFGMVAGGAGGTLGTMAAVIPSIVMLAPSLFGLLNPLVLISAALAGGVYYWFKYSEQGQKALASIMNFMRPFIALGSMMFSGIKDAMEAGDLGLAAQIAMAGLKAIVLRGVDELANAIGGVFGNTLGQFATQLLGGNFAGAWSTALEGMGALWDIWTVGVIQTFTSAAKAVMDVWYGMVDKIANKILDMAGEGGIVGTALSKVLGVDVAEEKARAERLNRQAAGMGLAQTDVDAIGRQAIAGHSASAKAAVLTYLDSLNKQSEDQANQSVANLTAATEGGTGAVSEASAQAEAELARLREEARKRLEEVKSKEKAKEEAERLALGQGVPGGAAGRGGLDVGAPGKSEATATFSAYALAAQGGTREPTKELVRLSYSQRKLLHDIHRELKKTDDMLEKITGGLVHS